MMPLYNLPRDRKLLLLDFERWDWERSMAFRYRELRRIGVPAREAYARARREALES